MEDPGGQHDLFREAAMPPVISAGDAEHPAIRAKIDIAALAFGALATELGGIKGHPVSGVPAGHARADLGNETRRFMAHDEWRNPPAAAPVHPMDVAAADAAGFDRDPHLPGAEGRIRKLGELKGGSAGQEEGLHAAEGGFCISIFEVDNILRWRVVEPSSDSLIRICRIKTPPSSADAQELKRRVQTLRQTRAFADRPGRASSRAI